MAGGKRARRVPRPAWPGGPAPNESVTAGSCWLLVQPAAGCDLRPELTVWIERVRPAQRRGLVRGLVVPARVAVLL